MFVHHDILLNAYPLCLEWLGDAGVGREGSFAAVGLIDHTIHLWDLEDPQPLEPVGALGRSKKKKKTSKKVELAFKGVMAHDGPVLCVNGSNFNRNVLASGSADETLK